jgi:hypothetical protein
MAAQGGLMMTVPEWCRHFHRGKLLPDIAMLVQSLPMLNHIPFQQCNDGTTHLFRQQLKLPDVHKVMHGEGTPESKSQSGELRESCTIISGFSTIPVTTAMLHGQRGAVRAREDRNFHESSRQLFSKMLCYDNRANNPRDINGICTLLNSLTGTKAKNVISCGGTTANAQASIVFFNWGPDVYGLFPEGTNAGYQKYDRGTRVRDLSNGRQLTIEQTEHMWHVGLCVEAWPSTGRICNIEVADALALTNNQSPSSFQNVLHAFMRMKKRFRRPGKLAAYCPESIHGLFERLATEKSSGAVRWVDAQKQFGSGHGTEQLMVCGVPVYLNDAMLETEPVVP